MTILFAILVGLVALLGFRVLIPIILAAMAYFFYCVVAVVGVFTFFYFAIVSPIVSFFS